MATYRVRHAFAHEGTIYTRRNEAEVSHLPESAIAPRLALGFLELVAADPQDGADEAPADPTP